MKWSRQDGLALAALAIAPFVQGARLFVPLFGSRVYFPDGDFVDQFYAFASLKTTLVASGEWPLWNPYAYGGSPLWADIQAAVTYPIGLLVVLLSGLGFGRLPFAALEFEALAHLSLAGVFTYLFARRALGSRPGAALAALCFAMGGYLTGYPPLQLAILETAVWLPLALLGVMWTVGRGRKLPHPLLPGSLALAILAGHPQSGLFVFVATLAWFAWLEFVHQPRRPRATDHAAPSVASSQALSGQPDHRGALRAYAWARPASELARGLALPVTQLAITVALALGVSASGWLPAWQFWQHSNRTSLDYVTVAHGFAPRELLGLFWPTITHWAPLYVGLLPLTLAVGAGWRALVRTDHRARRDRFWVALGLTALMLSLGGHSFLFPMLYRFVPGFALFRGQERAAFLVSFSLALLAGRGFDLLLGRLRQPSGRQLRPVGRLALIAILTVSAADLGAHNGLRGWDTKPPRELARSPVISSLARVGHSRCANEDRLPPNFGVLHGIESTSGASPLRLRRFERLRNALTGELEPRLWDLLAVERVISVRATLGEPSLAQSSVDPDGIQQYVHRLRQPNPRAWWVPRAHQVPGETEALAAVAEPGLDLRQVVIVESRGADAAWALGGPAAAVGRVQVLERRPGFMRLASVASSPGWLVISEMYMPGWRARLDGQPIPVLPGNGALLTLAVPPGDHQVELRLTAPLVATGLGISGLCGLVLTAHFVALGAWWSRRPRGLGAPKGTGASGLGQGLV